MTLKVTEQSQPMHIPVNKARTLLDRLGHNHVVEMITYIRRDHKLIAKVSSEYISSHRFLQNENRRWGCICGILIGSCIGVSHGKMIVAVGNTAKLNKK